jgi:galactokinase
VNWFQPALDRLQALPQDPDRRLKAFLSPERPLYIARAPGRLDVMGGIADYSGARVLELPLACSTSVLVQPQAERHCDIATRRGERWDLCSIDLPLAEPPELAAWFQTHETDRWAGYVVGVVQVMLARSTAAGGLRILIDSSVPEGKGVASSAALEVAVAMAVGTCYHVDIAPTELAALCQRVENHVVGAPCGIMDQMTSACGKEDTLLNLRCQPGTIEGYVTVPHGYRFYGIDSGITHAVSGADYGTVRTAAFMGLRILTSDTAWHGQYLADLLPSQFAELARVLPEEMSGAEFLQRYGGTSDSATRVVAERCYPVRRAAAHPVHEQQRVDQFAALLHELRRRPGAARELGELMYASHESYGACGLGSDGTDRLVALVKAEAPEHGLFGAKITGGGSGGTVAVFATSDAEPFVRDLAARYSAETGRATGGRVFAESGPGAAETGVLERGPGVADLVR